MTIPERQNGDVSQKVAESQARENNEALVTCVNCGARYRVPAEHISKPGLKLKCTSCDTMFPVHEGLTEGVDTPSAREIPAAAEGAPDFYPSAADTGEPAVPGTDEPAAPGTDEREMPLPDDSQVSTMFDDLKVNLHTTQAPESNDPTSFDPPIVPPPAGGGQDPERAYLDAISLTEDGSQPTMPSKGKFSDAQKYKFFLKPGTEGDDEMADGNGPEEEALPPLDEKEQALAEEVETGVQGEPPFVPPPPKESSPDADHGAGIGADPALPALREEPQPSHPNAPVPDQEISKQTENFRYRLLSAAVALVLLIGAGWGAWLYMLPGTSKGYLLKEGVPAELTITNTRKGYFVTNKPSGERLYVLTGEIVNGFDAADQVGWIRLKGTAIGNGKKTRQSYSYIGNLLSDNQLATWALPAIQAYYGYLNGRNDGNYRIASGKSVPFQIVLAGVRQPIERVTTELVSYRRLGVPVYLDSYQ